jgi:hypothetical protein
MVKINKSDLKYKYSWNTIGDDNPKVTGTPDSTMFSRHEGYEVLYLINKLAEIWEFKNKSSCIKIETMINDSLPSDVRSQKNVENGLLIIGRSISKWILN